MNIIRENKAAIFFLLFFVGFYVILNTIYGFYIEYYSPQADPITKVVSKQVAFFLRLFDPSVFVTPSLSSRNITIANGYRTVIDVFEGCNGVNVMIVFASFLIAFRGSVKLTTLFLTVGLVIIHFVNLVRVVLLYLVEIHFPRYMYFFHKYFFTGCIYTIVFVMWYVWIKSIKREGA
jgi:exosortase family protein XrtF